MIEDATEILKDRHRLDYGEIQLIEIYIEACKADSMFSSMTRIRLWYHTIFIDYYNPLDSLPKHIFKITIYPDFNIICQGYKRYYKKYPANTIKEIEMKDIILSEVRSIIKAWKEYD